MNNDISDVNKFVKPVAQRKTAHNSDVCVGGKSGDISKPQEDITKSMNFLGAMGCAQVQMSNPMEKRVKVSVDSFLENPEMVQDHTDICDDLVKDGMPLEVAILATDEIMNTLQSKDTYK